MSVYSAMVSSAVLAIVLKVIDSARADNVTKRISLNLAHRNCPV